MLASDLIPAATPGSPPPPDPLDPPDIPPLSPSSPSFDFQFPSLQSTTASPPLSKKQISLLKGTANLESRFGKPQTTVNNSNSGKVTETPTHSTVPDPKPLPENTVHDRFKGFTVLTPKKNVAPAPNGKLFTTSSSNRGIPLPKPNSKEPVPSATKETSQSQTANVNPTPPTSKTPPPPTYAQKARPMADRSLKRLAPISYSVTGVPKVTIPDEVFHRGAEMHKEFIMGFFLAKMPSFQAIQSVLNFMWGKGHKLDIRTNKSERSFMVRIPNEFIRRKV